MDYQLRNCRTGEKAVYRVLLRTFEEAKRLHFCFTVEHSHCYCPHDGYNEDHFEGDVCEVFIGPGAAPRIYYEMEVTPRGDLFLAQITWQGVDETGKPQVLRRKVPRSGCFVSGQAKAEKGGYTAEIVVDRDALCPCADPLFFNAFCIETDGGEMEKHLFACNPTGKGAFHVPERFIPLDP